jgi:hypothetical protein
MRGLLMVRFRITRDARPLTDPHETGYRIHGFLAPLHGLHPAFVHPGYHDLEGCLRVRTLNTR